MIRADAVTARKAGRVNSAGGSSGSATRRSVTISPTADAAGAEVLTALLDAGWVTRARGQRAIQLTACGRQRLAARLGLDL